MGTLLSSPCQLGLGVVLRCHSLSSYNLVQWKRFMVESDTWEERENLENAKEAIEKYEKEY